MNKKPNTRRRPELWILIGAVVLSDCLLSNYRLAVADERQSVEDQGTTQNLIDILVQKGLLTKDEASTLLERAKQPTPSNTGQTDTTTPIDSGAVDEKKEIRVFYVPEFIKQQLRDEIRQDVMTQAKEQNWASPNSIPSWLDRISLNGDVRLRLERDFFASGNAPPAVFQVAGTNVTNTQVDRQRWLARARLGVDAKITDTLFATVRASTDGNGNNPISENQTLGDSFRYLPVFFDLAYVNYVPSRWLNISTGKFPNPWFYTDLVWDPDLTFDGVAVTARPQISDAFGLFGTFGAFPVQEIELSTDDKWLYGAQLGFEWAPASRSKLKVGAAYYDFKNVTGSKVATVAEAQNAVPQWQQKGNTLFDLSDGSGTVPVGTYYGLASDFRIANATAVADLAMFDPVHIVLAADYVKNTAFSPAKMAKRGAVVLGSEGDTGYQVRLGVGTATVRQPHDWQAFAAYRYLESDAVLDAFTDSEFHLGGTNTQGWVLGITYGLAHDISATARWISADEIEGPPLGIDVMELDLNIKF